MSAHPEPRQSETAVYVWRDRHGTEYSGQIEVGQRIEVVPREVAERLALTLEGFREAMLGPKGADAIDLEILDYALAEYRDLFPKAGQAAGPVDLMDRPCCGVRTPPCPNCPEVARP